MKNKVIVIVGPTAVGKTELSIQIAKKYNLEIINGDSIAIYQDLDIGSAKPTKEEQAIIKHHLIDIRKPGEDYSVAEFQKDARSLIAERPLSLICGGTGLYIQASLFNYEFSCAKRDDNLAIQFANYSNEELYAYLKNLDDKFSLEKIHPNNRKRVLRAIEIRQNTGKSISSYNHKEDALYDYYIIYLSMERQALYDRINSRVESMLKAGLEAEVRKLYEQKIYPKGIGYKEFIPYFENKCQLEDVVEEIKKNTRHLAKRQETWFKNQLDSHFYLISSNNKEKVYKEILDDLDRWLNI